MEQTNKRPLVWTDSISGKKVAGTNFRLKNGADKKMLESLAKDFEDNIKELLKRGELVVRVADYDYRRKTSQYNPNEIYHVNGTTLRISLGGLTAIPVLVYGEISDIEKNMSVYEKLIGDQLIQEGVVTT